jgi:hypothetical protein
MTVYSFSKQLKKVRHLHSIRNMRSNTPYSVLENGTINTTNIQDDVACIQQWPHNNQENRM